MLTQQFQNTAHTLRAEDKMLGFYDLPLTGSYTVKTAMINTAVCI